MDHPDRLNAGYWLVLVASCLAAFGLALFAPAAFAFGEATGNQQSVIYWGASSTYPSYNGFATSIESIRDADRAKDIADWNGPSRGYDISFHSWIDCATPPPPDKSHSCTWLANKKSEVDGQVFGTVERSISYFGRNGTQLVCTGVGMQKVDGPPAKCVCAPGFSPNGSGGCQSMECPKAGTIVPGSENGMYEASAAATSFVGCYDGCTVGGSFSGTTNSTPPVHWIAGPLVHTGLICNPASQGGTWGGMGSANSSPGQVAQKCPPPKCPGTVNGTQVCVPCNTTTTGEVKPPAPGASSPGVISKTECVGGVCTTTEQDIGADGKPVGSPRITVGTGQGGNPYGNGTGVGKDGLPGAGGVGDGEGEKFCEENPDTTICQSTSFAGSCMSQFTCEGDGVQCAIAKEQHARNCELFVDETEWTQKGMDALGKGDRPDGHPGADDGGGGEVGIDFASNIDRTNLLMGSCPAGHSLTVAGHSFEVITGGMCDMLEMLGSVVVAIGALASAVIVFRG